MAGGKVLLNNAPAPGSPLEVTVRNEFGPSLFGYEIERSVSSGEVLGMHLSLYPALHVGVILGADRIAHFNKTGANEFEVIISNLEVFMGAQEAARVRASGRPTQPLEKVDANARALEGFNQYDLLDTNCQHVSHAIRTGEAKEAPDGTVQITGCSNQVDTVSDTLVLIAFTGLGAGLSYAVASSAGLNPVSKRIVTRIATSLGGLAGALAAAYANKGPASCGVITHLREGQRSSNP